MQDPIVNTGSLRTWGIDVDANYRFALGALGEVALNLVGTRVGVTTLLDKDPPLLGAANCVAVYCNGNTFPQVYDMLGRNAFVSLTADF